MPGAYGPPKEAETVTDAHELHDATPDAAEAHDAHALDLGAAPATPSGKKLTAAQRRAEALRLLGAGRTQEQIAARIGTSQARVSQILTAELRRLAEQRALDTALLREAELQKLDAYERRMADVETRALAALAGTGAPRKSPRAQPRASDPAFLRVVIHATAQRLAISARRARLLGIEAPDPRPPDRGDPLEEAIKGLSPAVLLDLHERAAAKLRAGMAKPAPRASEAV